MVALSKPVLSKTCFVICPIGSDESKERKWSDTVLNHIIKPVVENYGYNAIRADQLPSPGTITSTVIEHLITSELVIADLSFKNPNVFYELAVRHAVRKPFIQMMSKEDGEIPFDTNQVRTIRFNLLINNADDAKEQLGLLVKSIDEGNINISNPIGTAIDIMNIQQSHGKKETFSNAKIFQSILELQSQIDKISRAMENTQQFYTLENNEIRQKTIFGTYLLTENDLRKEHQALEKKIASLDKILKLVKTSDQIDKDSKIIALESEIQSIKEQRNRVQDKILDRYKIPY